MDPVVRLLQRDDIDAVAQLLANHDGRPVERAVETVTGWLSDARRVVLVAAHGGGVVVGYAKAEWLDPEAQGGNAPAAWYLSGLLVAPAARRLGTGRLLTAERLSLLAGRAGEVRYFANLRNHASIALHQELGFVLECDDVSIPGVEFAGGRGGLFRWISDPAPKCI